MWEMKAKSFERHSGDEAVFYKEVSYESVTKMEV